MKSKKFCFIVILITTILKNIFCEKDLYKVLEVPRSASQNDIKKKYRELTRKYHPDKNQGNKDASEKFSEVAEAYETLSDPKKRRLYDRGGMDAVKNEGQMQEGGFDPFDMFGGMFGGGQRGGERRDQDLRIKLRVTLKDLYLGKEYEFAHTRNVICPHCRGNGAESHEDITVCDKCNGQGTIRERQMVGPGFVQIFERPCPKCGGKGKQVTKNCHVCEGAKIVKGLDEFTVYVEKGMSTGQEIKFEELGEERIDIAPGNLVFVIEQINDRNFRRENNDLHTDIHISLKEALLGFNREVKHLDDHLVTIKRDSIIQPGEVLRIKGEGMPRHQSSEKGDLYVKVNVIFPTNLTEKQIEIAKTLFGKRSYW